MAEWSMLLGRVYQSFRSQKLYNMGNKSVKVWRKSHHLFDGGKIPRPFMSWSGIKSWKTITIVFSPRLLQMIKTCLKSWTNFYFFRTFSTWDFVHTCVSSVTRLGDFWKFLVISFFTKLAQIFSVYLGYVWKCKIFK